jgi:hypothetical protein
VPYTYRRGTVDTFSYDGLNRRTFAAFGKNGNTYQDTINYNWDVGNPLTQAVGAPAGTIARTYEGLDRLTEEQTSHGRTTSPSFRGNQSTKSLGRRLSGGHQNRSACMLRIPEAEFPLDDLQVGSSTKSAPSAFDRPVATEFTAFRRSLRGSGYMRQINYLIL